MPFRAAFPATRTSSCSHDRGSGSCAFQGHRCGTSCQELRGDDFANQGTYLAANLADLCGVPLRALTDAPSMDSRNLGCTPLRNAPLLQAVLPCMLIVIFGLIGALVASNSVEFSAQVRSKAAVDPDVCSPRNVGETGELRPAPPCLHRALPIT